MTIQLAEKSGFDKWLDGIRVARGNLAWSMWDCEIRLAVDEYNRHLAGVAGYRPLDWYLIKAMLWVESGAASNEWRRKPMQIGVPGDPGLMAFLSGKEGGELIIPPAWKVRLTTQSAKSIPAPNIRAGIGYLLMRMAISEHRTVPHAGQHAQQVAVKPGDSLDRIARTYGTTVESLRNLNPGITALRPGQILKYQKASIQRVITAWRPITTSTIAQRYNGGGDLNYTKKLDVALTLVKPGTPACTQ